MSDGISGRKPATVLEFEGLAAVVDDDITELGERLDAIEQRHEEQFEQLLRRVRTLEQCLEGALTRKGA